MLPAQRLFEVFLSSVRFGTCAAETQLPTPPRTGAAAVAGGREAVRTLRKGVKHVEGSEECNIAERAQGGREGRAKQSWGLYKCWGRDDALRRLEPKRFRGIKILSCRLFNQSKNIKKNTKTILTKTHRS